MANYITLIAFFVVILLNIRAIRSSVQCLDESGKPVDWYVVYKLPNNAHKSYSESEGSSYLYITSETLKKGWIMSNQSIHSQQSLVAKTLKPLYRNQDKELWLVYNDQGTNILDGSFGSFGHAKGVVAANKDGGFWLVHSVPHFPPVENEYSYPKTGLRNGQSMLCISILKDQLDILGQILTYYKPLIKGKRISADLRSVYPQLVAAAEGAVIKKAPWQMFTSIKSAGGRSFSNFAKARKFNKDLYQWVAEQFQTSILTETWLNELHPLPSTCNIYEVLNVESIKFDEQPFQFSSSKDHSKWAVSKSISKPWVCIGDINRALHQEKRGGGTMCLEDKLLWKAYRSIVDKISECKS
ncbi:deoxyribonuclease II isoform X1 [Rhodnius prolixus]